MSSILKRPNVDKKMEYCRNINIGIMSSELKEKGNVAQKELKHKTCLIILT